MTPNEARQIAELELKDIQSRCPVAIRIIEELTQEHSLGFVFFFNAIRYLETGEFEDSLAGNGPILVRHNGKVIRLPSNQSVSKSLRALSTFEFQE